MRSILLYSFATIVLAGCETPPLSQPATAESNCLDRISYDLAASQAQVDAQTAAAKVNNAALGFGFNSEDDGPNVTRPVAIAMPTPSFPACAMSRGVEGSCTVHFNLNENGYAVDIVPICTNKAFAQPAIRSIQRASFEPATVNAQPVRFEGIARKVTFKLSE